MSIWRVEPIVYSLAAATALLVAVLAGSPSARRAAAVEPMAASDPSRNSLIQFRKP